MHIYTALVSAWCLSKRTTSPKTKPSPHIWWWFQTQFLHIPTDIRVHKYKHTTGVHPDNTCWLVDNKTLGEFDCTQCLHINTHTHTYPNWVLTNHPARVCIYISTCPCVDISQLEPLLWHFGQSVLGNGRVSSLLYTIKSMYVCVCVCLYKVSQRIWSSKHPT